MRKLLPMHLFVLSIVIAISIIPAWSKSTTHIGLFEKDFVHKFLKPSEYLHESDVKEGEVGYGLSVFRGTFLSESPEMSLVKTMWSEACPAAPFLSGINWSGLFPTASIFRKSQLLVSHQLWTCLML